MPKTAEWADHDIRAFAAGGSMIAVDEHSRHVDVPDWLIPDRHDEANWNAQVWQSANRADQMAHLHPSDRVLVMGAFRQSLRRPGEVIETTTRRRHGDDWHVVVSRRVNLLDDPRVQAILITFEDTGERATVAPAASTGLTMDHESPGWSLQYLDDLGNILEIEGMVEQLFGRTADALIGTCAIDLFPAETHGEILGMWAEFIDHPVSMRTLQLPMTRPGGDVWIESTFMNRLRADRSGTILMLSHDISVKRAREAALHAREAEFRLVSERVPSAMFRMTPDGVVTFGNARWHQLTGRHAPVRLEDLVHPDDRPVVDEALGRFGSLEVADGSTHSFEVRDVAGDRIFGVSCSIVGAVEGGERTVIAALQEMTVTAELRHRAEHDGLTGLLNRDALEQAVADAITESPSDLLTIFVDLDHFKAVNDTYGHHVGDTVLKEVARRLCDAVRPSDEVGRYGGDEFVLVCRGVPASSVHVVVDRIGTVMESPITFEGGSWLPRASVGTARWRPGDDVISLLRRADSEMFQHKREHHSSMP